MTVTSAPAVRSPVTRYAQSVVAGAVMAGRLVRLACARHLRDLEHGQERGIWFDAEAAQDAIDFFGFLELAEGEHEGKPFNLEPWQEFIVGSLFGWKGEDGYRRFRVAYIEVGKGNGKSPMAAGIALYCLVADGEAAAEVYTAAVNKDQASISFRDAKLMAEASPALSRRLTIMERNIAFTRTNSFLRPVSSERRGLDGKRVHCAVIDEEHEHPTDIVYEKMRAGTKGRRQALIIVITNSGYDRSTVCYQHHELTQKILEGSLENDSWFGYVAGLDPCAKCRSEGHTQPQESCKDCDDWRDEAVWLKANPNLDVSVTHKYLREQVAEASGRTAKQSTVQRLNFCIWTQSVTKWLSADQWELGSVEPVAPLDGRMCFAGLDLSSKIDLTAIELLFPDQEGGYDVLSYFFMPEENILERERQDGVPYKSWAGEGLIEATEGNVIDEDYILEKFLALAKQFQIREVGYDPFQAMQLAIKLERAGFRVVPIRQGFLTLSEPSKELEKLVRANKLRHGGNPVLRWMASNVVVRTDPAGNIKPDKEKSTQRIDGISGVVNGLSRAIVNPAGLDKVLSYA
jgi:phage terminase large subunit-like protein